MAGDDLNDPLGWRPDAPVRPARLLPWRAIGATGLCAAVTGLVALAWLNNDGMGGRPYAIARIEQLPKREPVASLPPPLNAPAATDTTATIRAASSRSAGDLETASGVRVVRRGGGEAPGALVIQLPEPLGVHLTPAPDRRLVEKGKFGNLPKIGADGARAAQVYARPFMTNGAVKPGAPRIALVVTGMGLSQQATQNAVSKLPGAVTLAFAPYGEDLEKQVARAREAGHEIVLQAPMESFDAIQSPGPHMLEVSATTEQNIEHLHWLMSRFSGYVGVSNFLGAKFTASDDALAPIIRETISRGLFFFDDGSSSQSRALSLPAGTGGSVIRADVVLDRLQKGDALEAELSRLEQIARQKGVAIGVAAGLPANVEQIARFARALEKRGVALAPLSSLAVAHAMPSAGNLR